MPRQQPPTPHLDPTHEPGWTPSNASLVKAVNDDPQSPGGAHLHITGAEVSVVSSAFVVPQGAQSLHLDYLIWSERTASDTSSLEIVALRSGTTNTPFPVGTVTGTLNAGWLHGVVDLQRLRGETIQLQFRTHWYHGRARIDNLVIQTEVPDWTISNASTVQVVNNDPQSLGGSHLLIDGGEHWALSPAFTVPMEAQSLHFDYLVWGDWTAPATRSLEVVAFRATAPIDPVSIGTVYGLLQDGWQTAVLDLQNFRGETIRLRFRSDWYFGNARIDNIALYVETPGWTPRQSEMVQIITDVPASPVTATEPGNTSFEANNVMLAPSAGPVNADFTAGQHSTTWGGFAFTSSNVAGWSVSEPAYVYSVSDLFSINDGYLLLNEARQWALSPVLTVPPDTQSLHFDYMVWAAGDATRERVVAIEVEVLSGPGFMTTTPLGLVSSTEAAGWQSGTRAGVLGLASFQGQPIKLRFRSDWNQGRARIDSIGLYTDVPDWTVSNARSVRVADEIASPGGSHLRLLGGAQWATSAPFTVTETAQSLHFDYLAWDSIDQTGQRVVAVEVEVLSGPQFTTTTRLGQVSGSANLGWKHGRTGATMDLQGFRGQRIKVRFRTDTNTMGGSARIDNLRLHIDIPQWTLSDSVVVRPTQDAVPHTSAIHITAGQHWAASEPFVVPLDAERLRAEYSVWSTTPAGTMGMLGIEVQSGDHFATTTTLGVVSGITDTWQAVLLDIAPFQGRLIRLRFRTHDAAQTQIDNLSLELGTARQPRGTDLAPDTSYLLLSQAQREVISAPFTVPSDMTSLYFDYLNWTDSDALVQRGLEVEVVREGMPPLLLGTVSGSGIQGWRQALLDVSSLHGQTIQLRFRTDWHSGKTKLDNVGDPNRIVSVYNPQAASPPDAPC